MTETANSSKIKGYVTGKAEGIARSKEQGREKRS